MSNSSLNSFLGQDAVSFDSSTQLTGRRFSGTSAAAPNVAALALLMLQAAPDLSPSKVYKILEQSAIDMNEPGFDFDSGYGFVNGLWAVKKAIHASDDKESKNIEVKNVRKGYCSFTAEEE